MRIAIDGPRDGGGSGAAVASPDEVAAIVAALAAATDAGAARASEPDANVDAIVGARWKRAGRVYDAYDASARGRHR